VWFQVAVVFAASGAAFCGLSQNTPATQRKDFAMAKDVHRM